MKERDKKPKAACSDDSASKHVVLLLIRVRSHVADINSSNIRLFNDTVELIRTYREMTIPSFFTTDG